MLRSSWSRQKGEKIVQEAEGQTDTWLTHLRFHIEFAGSPSCAFCGEHSIPKYSMVLGTWGYGGGGGISA